MNYLKDPEAIKMIIADIKNKFNTTKGNHKVNIYDDLDKILNSPEFKEYAGYYIELCVHSDFKKLILQTYGSQSQELK